MILSLENIQFIYAFDNENDYKSLSKLTEFKFFHKPVKIKVYIRKVSTKYS